MTPREVQDGIERARSAPIQDDVTARSDHILPLAWAECCGRFRYGGGASRHGIGRIEFQPIRHACRCRRPDRDRNRLCPAAHKIIASAIDRLISLEGERLQLLPKLRTLEPELESTSRRGRCPSKLLSLHFKSAACRL